MNEMFNLCLINVLILYPLKKQKNLRFSGVCSIDNFLSVIFSPSL